MPATAGPWDAFVAVGGGSSIDTAKAINLLLTNPGELMDYINVPVGKGAAPVNAGKLHRPPLHRLPAQDAGTAGALLRLEPHLGHVVGKSDAAARHVVPDGGPVRRRHRGPGRHGHGGHLRLTAERPAGGSQFLPSVLISLMREIDMPNGIAALGYTPSDIPDLVDGTLKQQRLLATSPKAVTADDAAAIFTRSMELW